MGSGSGLSNISGSNNTLVGWSTSVSSGALSFATAIGVNATAMTSNSITLGRSGGEDQVRIPGNLILITLSTGGFTSLCRNAVSIISTCSSSARYKSNIAPYTSGLDLISRLSPVSFIWKEGGMPDLGLVAEEVKQVEPLLTIDEGGEVEGVKYDRLGVVLINAVKEQQAQIERQSALIEAQAERLSRQQAEIDAFKKYVCSKNSKAEICKSRVRR